MSDVSLGTWSGGLGFFGDGILQKSAAVDPPLPPFINPRTPQPWGPGCPGCWENTPAGCETCNNGCPSPLRAKEVSVAPVRYASLEPVVNGNDVLSSGFGLPWGHTRSFASRMSANESIGNGVNWQVAEWTYLIFPDDDTVVVMGDAMNPLWFVRQGSSWVPEYFEEQRLEYRPQSSSYVLHEIDGRTTEYDASSGALLLKADPAGNRIAVQSYATNGLNPTQVGRWYFDSSGTPVTESFLYAYDETDPDDPRLTSVTLRRRHGGDEWTNVTRAEYTYYQTSGANGLAGDLQTVLQQSWEDDQWQDRGTSYYRYWTTASGSSSSSGGSSSDSGGGGPHLLKFVVGPASYVRLADDPNVTNPLAASDAVVAQYADLYFEYDGDRRVTKEIVQGGSRTFTFAASESAFSDGYNSWKYKAVETQPDGVKNVVYSNYAGQMMLEVRQSGSDEWCEFYQYDARGNLVLHAHPSAVSGYDEQYADLLNEVDGKYQYLRDNDGFIETYAYDPASDFRSAEMVRHGQLGCDVKVREYQYVPCVSGRSSSSSISSSSSSSSGSAATTFPTWFRSKEIVYPDAADPLCDSSSSSSSGCPEQRAVETSYTYTFYEGTCQIRERVTTLPVVSTGQNGSGVAATRRDYFDEYGNIIWRMDERGFITRTTFDIPTGAITELVSDVDTALYSDVPAGWSTPTGGGTNLVTLMEHDDRGRITQVLGPTHEVDVDGTATSVRRATWTVYDDGSTYDEIRTAQGYATIANSSSSGSSGSSSSGGGSGGGTITGYTLVNPVSINRSDLVGKPTQRMQATRTSTVGKLLPSDTFPQSTYTRWSTIQYTDCCFEASQRVYHTIPTSGTGSEGTNYDETRYGYDVMRRRNRTTSPGGTITYNVFDVRSRVEKVYGGTDDNGATSQDPTGGGAAGNNMVLVTTNQYDGGQPGGDDNLTTQTQHVDGSTTRVTTFGYDWRNRRTTTDGEIDFYQSDCHDNLDRVIRSDRRDTTASGHLVARSETKYDDRDRVFRTIRYGVDPTTGTVGNALTDNTWYDAAGNTIKQLPSGSKLFTKQVYDSLGRRTFQYRGYDLDETTHAEAGTVDGDTILEQTETTYDDAGNAIAGTTRMRYHNAPATQTGSLGDPTTTPKARVVYTATYPDPVARQQATANYGTNGGTALVRPSVIPSRSDDVLVSSMGYDSAGDNTTTTDPAGKITCLGYDDVGRETSRIQNCTTGSSSSASSGSSSSSSGCPESLDTNVTVLTAYNADGNVSTITALNSVTGNQTTTYVYGTTLSDSEIATSTLKRAEVYPDSVDDDDRITFAYNRQSETTEIRDQNGTVHTHDYDGLGRMTQDRVTTLGSGVDDAVRRIETTFEVRGMKETLTSYDDATAGQGNVVNQVQFAYDDFGQLLWDYQAHSGSVNTSTTPKVGYTYADGSNNTTRPTSLVYPDGRTITHGYGTTNGIDDAVSRVASLVDSDVGLTHLVDYSYLGLGTFVEADDTEPDVKWTMVDLSGSNDPDTGDIYSGFDRFGRVKDNRWYDYGSSTDVDRIEYGYDRVGNRTYRENVVARALSKDFDELYSYDGVDRLEDMARGTLNTQHTALTSTDFAQQWSLDETGNWCGFRQDDDGDGDWELDQHRTSNKVNEITDISGTGGGPGWATFTDDEWAAFTDDEWQAFGDEGSPSWVTPAYSRAGNMTTMPQPDDPTRTYTCTYDAWNRLVKVADGANTVSEYEYDGAKRRVIQKAYASGVLDETRHLYYTEPSQWQVIEERVGTSTDPDRQFVWGLRYIDDLVVRDRDTTGNGVLDERLYAMQDANWNVTGVVDTAGDVQQRWSYTAYGVLASLDENFVTAVSTLGWETLFAGYRLEAQTRLFHVRNRVYSATLGTWVQRDPLGLHAGTSLFSYAESNPLVRVDPSGTVATLIAGEFVIVLVAATVLVWVTTRPQDAQTLSDVCVRGIMRVGQGLLDIGVNGGEWVWDWFAPVAGGSAAAIPCDCWCVNSIIGLEPFNPWHAGRMPIAACIALGIDTLGEEPADKVACGCGEGWWN